MEEYINIAVGWCGWMGLILALLLVVLYFLQMGYYCGSFALVPKYSDRRRSAIATERAAISVVLPLYSENYAIFEELIPSILRQQQVQFELVIIYVGNDKIYREDLETLSASLEHVTTIHIAQREQASQRISPKLALNIGIKSAKYENILITDSGASISSDGWLRQMAEGFKHGDIVIGYSGWDRGGALFGAYIRLDRMIAGALALSSAINGECYRGWISNLGITRKAYFESRGFSNLNMNNGVDDLYVQHLAQSYAHSVVISPEATVRDRRWGSVRWWLDLKSFNHATFSLYNSAARWEIGTHSYSRFLLFVGVLVAIISMPFWFKMAAIGLLLTRWMWAMHSLARLAGRLGEGQIYWLMPIYDLTIAFVGMVIWFKSFKKDERVWR